MIRAKFFANYFERLNFSWHGIVQFLHFLSGRICIDLLRFPGIFIRQPVGRPGVTNIQKLELTFIRGSISVHWL